LAVEIGLDLERFSQALEELEPPRYAKVVRLAIFEDLDNASIAEAMSIKLSSVPDLKSRAIKSYRKLLIKRGLLPPDKRA
ncbi:MAG: sigma factor-like helix-turn-helix DNA-binding protein, partial [Bacteroidota bacterium]